MPLRRETLLLVLAVAVAGAASIAAGQDANWDLLNYHLYNPWAWLTGRYGVDVAPAGLQTFHHPLVDVPYYLMVAADVPPRVAAVALALPAGVAAYAVLAIARRLFGHLDPRLAVVATVAAIVVGVTGPNARAMLGTTMNEWTGTALTSVALLVVVRELHDDRARASRLVVAGLLAGIACGLKLTASVYALAIAAALPVAHGLRPGARDAATYALAVVAGMAATIGPWMVELYGLTGNPLFPYFNALFGSPWLPDDWTFRQPFGPRSLGEWLALPFDLLRPPRGYISEQRYRDARFPVVAALAIAAAVLAWRARSRGESPRHSLFPASGQRAVLRFGAAYFAIAFVLWAAVFGIHRYLLALEVLTGVAIVTLLLLLVPPRARIATIVTVAVAVVVTTRVPSWWRVPFGDRLVQVEAPALGPGTLVVVQGAPLAWLLPSLGAARNVGIRTYVVDPVRASGLATIAREAIAAHPGPLAVLRFQGDDDAQALHAFGVAVGGACSPVIGNLARRPAELCPLARP